jgi:RNA polymerase-binding transcription factor DksA
MTPRLLTDAEIEQLRLRLIGRQRELLAEVQGIENDLSWIEETREAEYVERGQEEAAARLLGVLEEHDQAELRAILAALDRIDNDNFGVCTECGDPIDGGRLEALPATPFCLGCAEEYEATGH